MRYADIMRLADAYAEAQRIAMIGGDIADITRARDALSLAVKGITDAFQWCAEELGHQSTDSLIREIKGLP